MRKFISLLLALMLACTFAIAEETALTEHNFGDFSISFPNDIYGSLAEEVASDAPFMQLFQDYDEAASFNKNLTMTWSQDVLDITAAEPQLYADSMLSVAVLQFETYGISVENPAVVSSEIMSLDGKDALVMTYSFDLDYSGTGMDLKMTLYTHQRIIPDEAFGGTYSITVSTDDLENTALLMQIADSIKWNV